MPKNRGAIDRIAGVLLAVVVAVLYLMGVISGLAAILLGMIAVIYIVASVIGFCPLHVPWKVSTRKQ